jgi:hypothetical protein
MKRRVADLACPLEFLSAGGEAVRTSLVVRYLMVAVLTPHAGLSATPADTSHDNDARTPVLDVRLNATVAMAPAPLVSTVFVAPHAENRVLRVSVDGAHYFRSSDIQLEGAAAPRSHQVLWRDLPAGEYQFTALLVGALGTRAVLTRELVVIGH